MQLSEQKAKISSLSEQLLCKQQANESLQKELNTLKQDISVHIENVHEISNTFDEGDSKNFDRQIEYFNSMGLEKIEK